MGQAEAAAICGIVSALPRIERVAERDRRRISKLLARVTVNCAMTFCVKVREKHEQCAEYYEPKKDHGS